MHMTQRKKKIFLIYIGMMAVFVLWLICSNSVIVSISGAAKLKEVEFEKSLFKDDIYYAIDTIEILHNFPECLDISGFAFAETEVDNSNKSVSIFLKGKDICYQAECNLFPKNSIHKRFPHNHILGRTVGFMADISTLGMKDGVYDLYVYCKENEENYGIANADYGASNVGLRIEKRGTTLSYYPWEAEQRSELLIPSQGETAVGAVDSASVEDDRLSVWGWAFAEGQDCAAQTVYLELTDEQGEVRQYTTKSAFRDGVVAEYKSTLYRNSGYRTSISLEDIADGTYTMRAILENGGKVWASQSYSLTKQGNTVQLGGQGAVTEEFVWDDSLFKDIVYFGIDRIGNADSGAENLTVLGWAYVESQLDNADRLASLILRGKNSSYLTECTLFARPEIPQLFPDRQIMGDMVGFSTNFSAAAIEDGIYDVFIYCKENEENYGVANADYGASNTGYKVEKHDGVLRCYPWEAEQRDELLSITQSEAVVGAVDFVGIQDGCLSIWGWAFAKGQNCAAQTVYLELTDEQGEARQYTTKSAVRDGVVDEYKSELYRESGYRTLIPTENMDDGTYILRALIVNDGEVWGSGPYMLVKNENGVELQR